SPFRQGLYEQRLEHALRLDRHAELRQVADAPARLIRIGLDLVDRDVSADRSPEPLRKRVHEMGVMLHVRFGGKASALRHGKAPPRTGSSTRPHRSNAARK